ncbi:uncharacterized protein LOC114641152 isoform X2 [Erpetoichthys calabaricus]|uniref:uncharacterized protein LOC114641152 isoform X2 n=1 Tax=Erpetoichthys calabaricus TaxID=27687 RepID=UPI00109FD420|nr:uncharacterized protein LOC114641152 isoform X2 [Erpetoichthys calabaricus]
MVGKGASTLQKKAMSASPVLHLEISLLGVLTFFLHSWSHTVTSLPGDTVSLNCSLSSGNSPMLWYRQLSCQPPHAILQTVGAQSSEYSLYTKSGEKFTCKEGHTLVIKNVTHNDTAIYYCVSPKQDPLMFNDGIHLTVNAGAVTPTDQTKLDKSLGTSWISITLASCLAVSMVAVIVLTVCTISLWRQGRAPSRRQNTDILNPQSLSAEDPNTIYSTINGPEEQQQNGTKPFMSTYAMVKMM